MEFETLKDFLINFVLTPGGAGAILYYVLEKFPYADEWFDSLKPAQKRLITFLVAMNIPVLGMLGATVLGYAEYGPESAFSAMQIGFAVFTASQLVHGVMGLRRK